MKRSTVLLIVIAASFAIGGLIEPFVPHPGQFMNEASVVHNLLVAILSFAWCRAHAEARGITPPTGSALAAGVFPPLGVPLYFFRSMPWRTALVATLKTVGYIVLLLVLFQAGMYVTTTLAT